MKPFPLRRETDAKEINAILNHPEVYPWVACRIPRGKVDLSERLADPRNVLLMARGGGFFFFALSPLTVPALVYEAHQQFLPAYRGLQVYHGACAAVAWMFEHTIATTLVAHIPTKHRQAQHVAAYAGFRRTGNVLIKAVPSPFGLSDAYEYQILRDSQLGAASHGN